jgi:hypothetical protein
LRQAARLDFVGATLVAGAVTCLVLALQWGGNTKPWNDKSVIIVSNFSTLSFPRKLDAKLCLVVRFCRSHQRRFLGLGEVLGRQSYGPTYDL